MLLQSPETQEIKYKKETITTFRIPLTSFCSKASQNLTNDIALFFFYNDMFFHQVLSIKDNMSSLPLMGITRFDHKTKVKARSERQNLQAASQLCTKQVGTREINQIIESLLKVNVQRITKTYQIET